MRASRLIPLFALAVAALLPSSVAFAQQQIAPPSDPPEAIAPAAPVTWYTTGDVLQAQDEGGETQTVRVRIAHDDSHEEAAGKDITLPVGRVGVLGRALEAGDRVVLRMELHPEGELRGTIVERTHGGIWIVVLLTMIIAVLVGRRQGLAAIAPTAFSLLVILFLLLPLILRGLEPVWAAVVAIIVAAGVPALLSFGWGRAAGASAAGAGAALLLTGLLAWGYTALAALSSVTSPALDQLRVLPGLSLGSLPLATTILVSVGAVLHIVNRVTARVFLERRQHPDRELIALLDVGITQGRSLFPSVVESALWVLFGITLPLLLLSGAQVSVFRIFLFGDPVRLLVAMATLVTGVAIAIPVATVTAALFASNER